MWHRANVLLMINLFLKLFQSTLWTLLCNVLKPLKRYIVYWKFRITKSSRWVSNYWKFITANILLCRHWHYFSFKINNSHAAASIPLLVRHQLQNTDVVFSHSIIFTGEFQAWCCRTTWWSCWINLGSHSIILGELCVRAAAATPVISVCESASSHLLGIRGDPNAETDVDSSFRNRIRGRETQNEGNAVQANLSV